MHLFARLRDARHFERTHLGELKKLEDFDLVREIGYHQERGAPLRMKTLYLLDLGSVATIQRRVRRLKRLGLIVQKKSAHDGRALELLLNPRLFKVIARYAEILAVKRKRI